MPILLSKSQHLVDSLTLIRELSLQTFSPDVLLFTFDVDALYPSIPIRHGLIALEASIATSFDPPKRNFIISLASLVLNHHYLSFQGRVWQQVFFVS